MTETVTLFRPVGIKELELIAETGWQAFPPRLFWQPIFYPVLNLAYAEQIASEWNTNDEFSGFCGIVTEFELLQSHYECYKVENVGGTIHNELWVPAENLNEFNSNIIHPIRVSAAFFGPNYVIPVGSPVESVLQSFYKQ